MHTAVGDAYCFLFAPTCSHKAYHLAQIAGPLTSSGTVCAQRWHHGKRQWPPGMQLWQGGTQRWRSDVACQDNAASPRHEVSSESESTFRYKGPLSQAVKNLKVCP